MSITKRIQTDSHKASWSINSEINIYLTTKYDNGASTTLQNDHAWSSLPACTWRYSLHYLFLQETPLFHHGVTTVCKFLCFINTYFARMQQQNKNTITLI